VNTAESILRPSCRPD